MLPKYVSGQKVLVSKIIIGKYNTHDIVVFNHPQTKRLLLKRVNKIKNQKYFLIGDNKSTSEDSRKFGWIEKKNIIGRVIYPKA